MEHREKDCFCQKCLEKDNRHLDLEIKGLLQNIMPMLRKKIPSTDERMITLEKNIVYLNRKL